MIDKRCVVILGAGASKPFDVPLASELLPEMLKKSSDQTFKGALRKFRDDFKLPSGDFKHLSEEYPNLEEILTIIKIREFAKEIPKSIRKRVKLDFDIDETFEKNLYVSLMKSVYENKRTKDFDNHENHPWHGFFEYCDKFAATTWCTFNWDALLDSSFYHWSDFWGDQIRSMKMHTNIRGSFNSGPEETHYLLKLHGGVNFWWNESNPDKMEYEAAGKQLKQRWEKFEKSDESAGKPAILEPSGFKYQSGEIYNVLKPQWDDFSHELQNASAVIIIGYSLPNLDPEVKNRLEATNANAKVIVFDPDDNVYQDYENIFGGRSISRGDGYGRIRVSEMKDQLLNWFDPGS